MEQLNVVQLLRDENDQLRERVRQLEQLLGFQRTRAPSNKYRLTYTESSLLSHLRRFEFVSKESAMMALYGDRVDTAPDARVLDVLICKIRRKLKDTGIEIVTVWGRGWRMSPESKRKATLVLSAVD